ncbi:MAG: FkbM family methyltransferase [Flavobacteriales bacterium]|nr:FkbM family methyltransferase [Flavobacteriales bacterium]
MKIEKQLNGANLLLDKDDESSYSATELLQMSDELKSFVLDNADRFANRPIKSIEFRGSKFNVAVTNRFWFWEDLQSGKWEALTFDVFDKYLDKETIFLDVGGWIGSTLFYAAQKVKKAVVFEPDPIAFAELNANLKLNHDSNWHSHCETIKAAVAPEAGKVKIGFRTSGGDSMSSVLLSDSLNSKEVEAMSLSEFIKDRDLKDEKLFVKMDVEGFEYDILPSLKSLIQTLPSATFHVSLHPQFLLDKLAEEIGRSKFKTSIIRKRFFEKHQSLLNSFKGYECTFINGKPFNSRKELVKALITGQFCRDLVFSR